MKNKNGLSQDSAHFLYALYKSAENIFGYLVVNHDLGMPLNAEQKFMLGTPRPLNYSRLGQHGDLKSRRDILYCLMMKAVYSNALCPVGKFRQRRVTAKRYGMGGNASRLILGMPINMLMQAASHCHVYQLNAAADTEYGLAAFDGFSEQSKLKFVTLGQYFDRVKFYLLAVMLGVNVNAAGENEGVKILHVLVKLFGVGGVSDVSGASACRPDGVEICGTHSYKSVGI